MGFGNPLRGPPGDATDLADFLQTLTGPIALVGHSYGGIVISAAATGNDQVTALVYFNGWMPDEGESQQQLFERFEGSLVRPAIRPVPFTGPTGIRASTSTSTLRRCTKPSPPTWTRPRPPSWPRRSGRSPRPPSPGRRARRPGRTGPLLVPARHRGQRDPTGAAAVHGRARERHHRGGAGLARLVRVAARGRDPAHPPG
ncbi:alpha/beta fold hydrolase [Geodermatophilus africanus]|uniref:alpha/beta fold hydrolase n=1 Tax=Geodermatophilus africanus TaxID=1137993 RepID=UPI003CC7A8E6